jgi:hypothetical protein
VRCREQSFPFSGPLVDLARRPSSLVTPLARSPSSVARFWIRDGDDMLERLGRSR